MNELSLARVQIFMDVKLAQPPRSLILFGQVHLWEVVESHPRSFMAIQFQTILIVKESGLSDARTM